MNQSWSKHEDPSSAHTDEKIALSIRDAASLLGVSQRTIERLIADGRLRSVTLARRRLIPRKAIEDLIELGTNKTPDGEAKGELRGHRRAGSMTNGRPHGR